MASKEEACPASTEQVVDCAVATAAATPRANEDWVCSVNSIAPHWCNSNHLAHTLRYLNADRSTEKKKVEKVEKVKTAKNAMKKKLEKNKRSSPKCCSTCLPKVLISSYNILEAGVFVVAQPGRN